MKTKPIVWIFVLLLLVSIATAYTLTGVPDGYSDNSNDYILVANGEGNNDKVDLTTCQRTNTQVANGSWAYSCACADAVKCGIGEDNWTVTSSDLTCEMWVRLTNDPDWSIVTVTEGGTWNNPFSVLSGAHARTDGTDFEYYDGAAYVDWVPANNPQFLTWHHFKWHIRNGSSDDLEANFTYDNNPGGAYEDFKDGYVENVTALRMISLLDNNAGSTHYVDDIYCYEGLTPPVTWEIFTVNLSTANPTNDSQFSTTTLDFNLTANLSYSTVCTLNINATNNQSRTYAAGTDVFVNFTQPIPEGGWFYSINCSEGTTTGNDTTINHTFYIDVSDPVMVTNLANNTAFFPNITVQFNFTDNIQLHSINISIDNTVYQSFLVNGTVYNYNFTQDITGISAGEHVLKVVYADGHTANELKGDYDVKARWGYIEYDMYGETTIRTQLKDKSIFDKWTSERKKDRYTQVFEPNKPSSSVKLVEQSTQPIYIKHTPGYYNDYWIITGNHWKDYVIEGEPNAKVSIEQIDLYTVEVTISGLKNPDKITFNSIGDLNIVTETFLILTTNATLTMASPVGELQEQTISLRIEKPTGITSTNATLYWNETITNRTRTIFATYDLYSATFTTKNIDTNSVSLPVSWQYNITSTGGDAFGNITVNQTVIEMLIDNCTTYHMRAINFSVRYQDNESELVTADIDGYFEVWLTDETTVRPFNLTWRGGNDYGICISPNSSSYNVFGQVEFTAAGYNVGTYHFINTTFDNSTDIINLYVTNASLVTFHVSDQDDDDVADVYIHILKYDLPTNSYVVSEIIRTDTDGNALGLITLNTVWYKFLLVYEDEIKLETEPTKITASPRNFRINLLDDYFENFDETQGITTELSFTNSTKNFAYTFLNPAGSTVTACLGITRRSINGDTLVNDSCLTAASGTILLNIGENVGTNTYIGVGSITRDGDTFVTDTLSVNFDLGYKTYGISGLFVSFFIILTLVLIGVWNPAVSVLFMILGVVATHLLDFFHLDWQVLIAFIIVGIIALYRVSRR